ncbi:hypothetical protein JX265_009407 [Neoarthrinium moseri]|uniref:Mitochondrial inner membrane protein 1 n=1 Tax=Neoarthrinium moseri TaxID=1658444 RepID=A0A9P9WGM4_9PEZI|nr:hypothetical protein JX266_011975 [Neoarthrinium moseri]KAI1861904.1 hypothetical protein JX265_009407 [Neoarthrinium moseri]
MLRSTRPLLAGSTRAVARQRITTTPSRQAQRHAAYFTSPPSPRIAASLPIASRILPVTHKTAYATKPPGQMQSGRDPEEEKKWAEQKLKPHPESVSSESSVRHLLETGKEKPRSEATPVAEGIKHDLGLVKETFALNTVPKESYVLGLAGTIPYLATSASTLYLSWALNTDWPTSSSFLNGILMDHDSARYWLGVIEPIQLGYGAVIISFLGAIHWGLEYAEKTPSYDRTRFRYGLGLLASVVAWPTLFIPWQFGLTSQFAAFVGLYFADSRAAVRGWVPSWYASYRFVLTAIVGLAIMLSLIGRMKIGPDAPRLTGLSEKFHATNGEEEYSDKWAKAEEEEKVKRKKAKQEEEKRKTKEEAEQKKKEEAEKKKKKTGGKDDKVAKEGEGDNAGEGKDEGKEEKSDGKDGSSNEDKADDKKKDEADGKKKDAAGDDKKDGGGDEK